MNVGRPRTGAIADINVTPMADVMIVLLIIFMVATPIIARPVELPKTSHLTQHKGERLEIVLRRGGGVAIDGVSLPSTELLAEYLGARTPVPESLLVLIQADRDASYGDATLFVRPSADISYSRLVAALDVAKGAGASRIGLVEEDSKPAGR